ncbi:MAG: bi-domain-containing oxidoreductase [Spirochaetaceae bacterium]|nr:bi-domain-containing oxidoreductase [Spirochaetaceae bacterium]
MRQVLQSQRKGELRLADVPVPACGPGGVLVRTRSSVISAGTEKMLLDLGKKSLLGKARARPDLVRKAVDTVRARGLRATAEQVFAKLDEPVPLGYSASGEVVEAGRSAAGMQPGDRVAIAGAGYASHAEFNFVPRNLCARIPEGVSYADAAFATVGAIALQGVRQAQPLIGERVVVIGLGLIGLLTVQILKANGCAVLGVDPDEERAALAATLGADMAVSSDGGTACAAFTAGHGADAVIIAAATPSSQPIEQAAELSRHKGRVVAVGLVGMQVPRDAFYRKELDLRLAMSYGPGRYDPDYEERGNDYPFPYVRFTEQRNLESFLYLVQQKRVTPAALVPHRLPFADALDAYALIEGTLPAERTLDRRYLGILLEYPGDVPCERTVRRAEDRAEGSRGSDVGVGLIGAGSFARSVLLPQIAKAGGARLTAVCTSTGRSAAQTAERFKFAVATTDAGEVLERADTEAVFIATRHGSHASLVAAALRAGKHVFVEKPLCIRESELDEVERALQDARVAGFEPCLMVGFNRRFSPHARALQEAFRDRGTPMVVNYRVNAGLVPAESWLHDPEEGGGRIIGEACHFVDFCSVLIGSGPVSVVATSIASDARDVLPQDSSVITIRYVDGSLATIQYLALGHRTLSKERCEVFADGRNAVMDDFRTTRFHGGGRSLRGKQAKGFAEEIDAFLSVCRDGGPWPISWTDVAATHRVCFGALRSLETGTMVDVG